VLRGDVVRDVRVTLQSGQRAGDHDRTAAPLDQARDRAATGVPYPGQVDVDHVSPLVVTDAERALRVTGDPGVGKDDVDASELGGTGLDRGGESGAVP